MSEKTGKDNNISRNSHIKSNEKMNITDNNIINSQHALEAAHLAPGEAAAELVHEHIAVGQKIVREILSVIK